MHLHGQARRHPRQNRCSSLLKRQAEAIKLLRGQVRETDREADLGPRPPLRSALGRFGQRRGRKARAHAFGIMESRRLSATRSMGSWVVSTRTAGRPPGAGASHGLGRGEAGLGRRRRGRRFAWGSMAASAARRSTLSGSAQGARAPSPSRQRSGPLPRRPVSSRAGELRICPPGRALVHHQLLRPVARATLEAEVVLDERQRQVDGRR